MSIESLAERLQQFNEGFELWVETDFKDLLDKTDALVVATGILRSKSARLFNKTSLLLESSNKLSCSILELLKHTEELSKHSSQ